MTREEIAAIEAYCDDNKISRKNRLAELGISEWQFYSSKRHYAPSRDGVNVGGFLQLEPGGAFLPDPCKKQVFDQQFSESSSSAVFGKRSLQFC